MKDPNSGLPKCILIAWCGGGVPERTKGYFTSHLNAVSKILHGYHVQITARSDSDLEPESIMQKVANASGAKYSAGSSTSGVARAPPPIKSKPVFTPTSSSTARVDPIVAARSRRGNDGDDGWGADAPPVTRSEIQKVESAYKPTKVNMAELTSQKSEPSRFGGASRQDDASADVVKGGYQPVGKVDIAAIRAAAKNQGDDRPAAVKGAYEPVGKVDIAAIRAKAQKPAAEQPAEDPAEQPRSLADRSSAFSQPAESERLTSMPKPKVANKFGGAASFAGTKAPTPGGIGFGGPSVPSAAPVGAASRTFADQGGKTPAQIWAEKKAKQGSSGNVGTLPPQPASPIANQKSGSEWKSGYAGKSWAPVQTSSAFGRPEAGASLSAQNTGENDRAAPEEEPSGGFTALKDRFKDTAPIGAGAPPPPTRAVHDEPREPSPPPVPEAARPSGAPSGGFALPGLPSRPAPADEQEEEEDDRDAYRPEPEREESPPRVAVPVARGADPVIEPEETRAPPPLPPSQIDIPREEDLPSDNEHDARVAAEAVAQQTFEPEQVAAGQNAHGQGEYRAVVQYDYEKAEDNEIELIDGQYITEIDMVDEDWWVGTNSKGERGLFPANYVELVADDDAGAQPAPVPAPAAVPAPAPVPASPSPPPPPAATRPPPAGKPTATALYDYEAAEDNGELGETLMDK